MWFTFFSQGLFSAGFKCLQFKFSIIRWLILKLFLCCPGEYISSVVFDFIFKEINVIGKKYIKINSNSMIFSSLNPKGNWPLNCLKAAPNQRTKNISNGSTDRGLQEIQILKNKSNGFSKHLMCIFNFLNTFLLFLNSI